MSHVALKKNVLQWALARQGLSLSELRKKFPKLSEWLAGSAQPTLRQVEALAKTTHTPLGFFFLDTPPVDLLPIPHFRTADDKKPKSASPDLLETVHLMELRQAWIREYLIEQGEQPLSFTKSVHVGEKPSTTANVIREALRLKIGWASEQKTWTSALAYLREAMENAGILVVVNGIVGNNTHRKLETDEFRGFVLADKYAPLVFINGADGKAAQMFTLAHELAHVFLGKSAAFDLREMQAADDPSEQACNSIAAEFLVPEAELKNLWPTVRKNKEPFQDVARHFKVSVLVAARRTLDLGMVTRKNFIDFYDRYLADERRNKSKQLAGGDFYASQGLRIGKKFGEVVFKAVKEGKLLYSDAYRLTGLYGRAFSRFAKSQGFEE